MDVPLPDRRSAKPGEEENRDAVDLLKPFRIALAQLAREHVRLMRKRYNEKVRTMIAIIKVTCPCSVF